MDRLHTLQVRGLVRGDIPDTGEIEIALMEAVYAVLEAHNIEGAPSAYVELLNPLELVPNSLDSDSFENY
jgi:hypothetical protein